MRNVLKETKGGLFPTMTIPEMTKTKILIKTHHITYLSCVLQRQDARIIVGVFYEDMARRVFCQVRFKID